MAARPLYTDADNQRDCDDGSTSEAWRANFYRDFARVIHSPSWRRLQGKTQLFPGHESDFFRNRLTHSLEVSQISEAIAVRLNFENDYLKNHPISSRLCATAGLMHDLGHPPFGHNGEHALDEKMREFGGFEGNAQTLRIITCLEKKVLRDDSETSDPRVGLNLTYRTIASALKYDKEIPLTRERESGLEKGFYAASTDLIDRVKDHVAPLWRTRDGKFKTIECAIMDIADDIAYSTYDLEDSLKAGFLTAGDILASSDELLDRVARKASKPLGRDVERAEVLAVLMEVFSDVTADPNVKSTRDPTTEFIRAYRASRRFTVDGHTRTKLTAELVGKMVKSVEVDIDLEYPALSHVHLTDDALLQVEVLKNYTYEATISSSRLKVAEYRGHDLVGSIFEALSSDKGHYLLPDDARAYYDRQGTDKAAQMRVVCDFVAGMTDRYAVEFYGRLHTDGQTMFKDL